MRANTRHTRTRTRLFAFLVGVVGFVVWGGLAPAPALAQQNMLNVGYSSVNGGTGEVTSSPAGIDCTRLPGSPCTAFFDTGTVVTLTATPDSGSTFGGWSGGGCSGTGTCAVTLNADTFVTAVFSGPAPSYTLTVSKSGSGAGTVTSSPAGINCGLTCSGGFSPDSTVTLTATPSKGSTFGGWSGGHCSGTGKCSVWMLNNLEKVTATFNKVAPPHNTVRPKITGIPQVGKKLSCSNGTWTGSAPLNYTRQWLRNGVAIPGKTASTYTVQSADAAKKISCRVTAKNSGGQSSATSAAVTINNS